MTDTAALTTEQLSEIEDAAMQSAFDQGQNSKGTSSDADPASAVAAKQDDKAAGSDELPTEVSNKEQGAGDTSNQLLTRAELEAKLNEQSATFQQTVQKLTDGFNGLKGYVKQMTQTAASATKAGGHDTPTAAKVTKAMEDAEEYKKLREEYPAWGAAMDAQLNKLKEHTASVNADAIEGIVSQRVTVAVEQVENKLIDRTIRKHHKDWINTLQSEPYTAWLNGQPANVQELALTTEDPDDIVAILNSFEASKSANADDNAARKPDGKSSLAAHIQPHTKGGAAGSKVTLSEDDYMEQAFQEGRPAQGARRRA